MISCNRFASILAAVALAPAILGAQRADTSLALTGSDGKVKYLTITELRQLPQVELKLQEAAGSVLVVRGPSVRALLTAAGAPVGQMLRGPSLLIGVVAEGTDGYKVVFSLAELDEQFGARPAIVALTQNGRPLSAMDGPLRMIMGAEDHRARWVRHLSGLRLVSIQ